MGVSNDWMLIVVLCYAYVNYRNLQDAVGSYYDYEQVNSPMYRLPSIAVLKDTTIGEGESVAPSSRFVKRWEVKNTGEFSLSNLSHVEPLYFYDKCVFAQ
jgi:hypothetical protein